MSTSSSFFPDALLAWYDNQGRKHLPWREDLSPYRVWVSEIMLQQTQVATVIPYFERFMARFPTIHALAVADLDGVLDLWTGLGYYARARNLHQAAKQIVAQGKFPDTQEELQSLPGIGRSTAGAILAIAFNKKAAILDGNVKRVLARFHAIDVPNQTQASHTLWQLAEQYTPDKRVGDYTQAIMDLGATLCTRTKPQCSPCPVAANCQAQIQNKQSEFPRAKARKISPVRSVMMLIFHDLENNQVLLEKRPPVGIWGGLWSFPECAGETDVARWCRDVLNVKVLETRPLPAFEHVFSHFKWQITPLYIAQYQFLNRVMDSDQYVWHSLNQPTARGFSAPVKRLLQNLG